MKRTIFTVIIVLTSFLIFLSSAWGGELKIGYVDLFKAFNESNRAAEAKKTFEEMVKTKQSAIDKIGNEVDRIQADMEKQAAILTPEARKKKEEERNNLLREYQRLAQESQEEIRKKDAELTQEILRELRTIVGKIGEEEGYTIILEVSEGGILYSPKKFDITEKVIKRYNETTNTPKTKPKK